jgi:hypothetical protein
MRTVIETSSFQKKAEKLWSEDERFEFVEWISVNPTAGDVIPGANGARKIRWSRGNQGKRGGVRIIYFHMNEHGYIILVTMYAKNDQENISPGEIPHGH